MEANSVSFHSSLEKVCREAIAVDGLDRHVTERVIENIRILVHPGMYVNPQSMVLFSFAIKQLCSAKSTSEINWLGVIALAADIVKLWSSNSLK